MILELNAPTKEQEEIIALRAELEKGGSKPSNKPGSKPKSSKQKKTKRDSEGRPIFKGTYKWKGEAPKRGEPTTKEVDEEKYYWCPHHKYWTLHKPEECRLKDNQRDITAAMAEVGVEDFFDSSEDEQETDDE